LSPSEALHLKTNSEANFNLPGELNILCRTELAYNYAEILRPSLLATLHETPFSDITILSLSDLRNSSLEFKEEAIQEGLTFSKNLERNPNLNPLYTFSSFVRGPSNQFALATCLNVAENPGTNYNPLFLYGSTGLGKTHLLHAVGNEVLRVNRNTVVTYISSERFMNEMIYCIRHNKMWDFRQKYRTCDLFMMDDIQFISGNKSATQEEFFHTFNTLYEAKKQIIITSDLFPHDIPEIEERLRNRFQWGLIADIQPPDVEHRIAILFNKAESLRIRLPHDVAEYIATYIKRNVRELEGALRRIAAFSNLHARPLDLNLAREVFRTLTPPTRQKVEIELVQKCVADHFKLKVSDLKSKKRLRALSLPRQIAMFLSRKFTQSSYPDIGSRFGGKDHTTVMHAVKKIELSLEQDVTTKRHVETVTRLIEQTHEFRMSEQR
jgi:chromosomal replication initiator protein